MLSFLEAAEKPLAYGTFAFAVLVIYWKTVDATVSFLPGFHEVFGGPGSQYPRGRNMDREKEWDTLYLCMYGILGTVAQFGGLQISLDKNREMNNKTISRAKLLGLFHTVIAMHHTMWSLIETWGRLDLDEFGVPYLRILGGVVGAWTGWHGLQLLLSSSQSTVQDVVHHKTIVDSVALMTLIEVFAFMPANVAGYRNRFFEQAMWTITFLTPFGLLVADAVDSKKTKEQKKTK